MKTDSLDGYRRYLAAVTAPPRLGAKLDRRYGPVRLPATPMNRECLRALREAEMLAWERAAPTTRSPNGDARQNGV